jgi:hypothetical protein
MKRTFRNCLKYIGFFLLIIVGGGLAMVLLIESNISTQTLNSILVVVFLLFLGYFLYRNSIRALRRKGSPRQAKKVNFPPDRPQPFGYKGIWMVVKERPIGEIVQALGLQQTEPCNWANGVWPGSRVFVSPPVKGWNFIVGLPFSMRTKTVADSVGPYIVELSKKLGIVNYFLSHRVTEFHIWARAENGKLLRGYCWLGETGETQWNEGEPAVERELGWKLIDENSQENDPDAVIPGEENVMAVARKWCLAPVDLKPEDAGPADGVIGWTGLESPRIRKAAESKTSR